MIPAALLDIPPKYFIIIGPIHLFMQLWYHTQLIDKMGLIEYILVTYFKQNPFRSIAEVRLKKIEFYT